MKTCTVTVRVLIGNSCTYDFNGKPDKIRTWSGVDIMRVSHTRAWATRQFNNYWNLRKKNTPIRVEWECRYDDDKSWFRGSLSGVNNIKTRRGIFEH